MSLVVTGLSHHTSPLALRERLAFGTAEVPGALLGLRQRLEGAGVVVLTTCNRTELYVHHVASPQFLQNELRAFLMEAKGVDENELNGALYDYSEREAAGHLFRVTSSLDSLVVGEGQILGQVHDAYQLAQAEQVTDKVINGLFQKAFTVAKKVRDQTDIGLGKVSVSSVAIDLAVSIFMDLSNKTVLVIGSGETGELTVKALVDAGVKRVLVANRDPEKARALAGVYGGDAHALAELENVLPEADIVVTSTASPEPILRPDHFQQALKARGNAPMFVIDIAVPRDVDAAVNEISNVYLYDIDDLQEVAEQNLAARRAEVDRCLEIVEKGVDQFERWYHSLKAEPTIVSLSSEFHAIRERELQKTLAQLQHLNENDRQAVEYLSKRIVNTILQKPLTQLKQEAHEDDHTTVMQLVRRLFGLKEST